MSSADVLSQPTPAAVEAGSLQHGLEVSLGAIFATQSSLLTRDCKKASSSWRQDARKANANIASMLDQKAEAHDVVALDAFVQPIDRGPAAADAQRIMRTWQYQATGKVAAAAALTEMKAEHVKYGGVMGVHAEALKHIEQRQLEDTFYIVDLGNVQRMYKARLMSVLG